MSTADIAGDKKPSVSPIDTLVTQMEGKIEIITERTGCYEFPLNLVASDT